MPEPHTPLALFLFVKQIKWRITLMLSIGRGTFVIGCKVRRSLSTEWDYAWKGEGRGLRWGKNPSVGTLHNSELFSNAGLTNPYLDGNANEKWINLCPLFIRCGNTAWCWENWKLDRISFCLFSNLQIYGFHKGRQSVCVKIHLPNENVYCCLTERLYRDQL